jgi:hypothetical protein
MFAGLPNGFTFGKGKSGHMMGETWSVGVYYNKSPAFQMLKEFEAALDRPRYAARSVINILREDSKDWQEFSSLGEMVLVMCTRHRMGVE